MYNNIISRIDSYTIYILWSNFVIAVITVFLIFIPTRIPRKVMLQKDNWRVKHLSYHSRIMNYDDIISVSEKYCLTVLINWRGWPCRLLHFNPLSKGVYIQLKRGSYFLKSRDNTALIEKFKTHMKSASDDDISADVITHEHAENLNPNASHSQVR